MRKIYLVALVSAACFLPGCASFVGHYDYMTSARQNTPTAFYPGTVTDCSGIALGLSAPVVAPFSEDVDAWMVLVAPLALIDLPFSFLLDTLFLPSDLRGYLEDRPYRKADDDPFWDDAFRTDVVTNDEARQRFSEPNWPKIVRLLNADTNSSAPNAVSVIFEMTITNTGSRVVTDALCRKTGLQTAHYARLYDAANSGCYGPYGTSMVTALARNISIPENVLTQIASSSEPKVAIAALGNSNLPSHLVTNILHRFTHDPEVAIAALGNNRLPPHLTTNILDRLAHSDSLQFQHVPLRHPATPPALLRYLASATGEKVAVAQHPSCPADLLVELVSDEDRWVRKAVAGHPSTPPASLRVLATDKDALVREGVAGNPSTPPDTLAQLDGDAEYHVRVSAEANRRKRK